MNTTRIRATWHNQVARLLQTLQTWPWLDTLHTLRRRIDSGDWTIVRQVFYTYYDWPAYIHEPHDNPLDHQPRHCIGALDHQTFWRDRYGRGRASDHDGAG